MTANLCLKSNDKTHASKLNIEEVDGGSVFNMQELLTKRTKEALIKEKSSTGSYSVVHCTFPQQLNLQRLL